MNGLLGVLWDYLQYNGEENGEPGLCAEVVAHERDEGVGRVQVEGQGREGRGQQVESGQKPQPGSMYTFGFKYFLNSVCT